VSDKRLKRKGGRLQMGGEGPARKSKLSFGRSRAPGEFLRVTMSRHDPDDQARWSQHFALDQAVFMAMSLLLMLPPKVVLAMFAQLIEARQDVRDLLHPSDGSKPEVSP
jgi:hypothetical protein